MRWLLLATAFAALGFSVLAYRVDWWAVSAGGSASTGTGYKLYSVTGQSCTGTSGTLCAWFVCGALVGPPGTAAVFRVERETGNVLTDGAYYGTGFISGSADVAEWVPVSELVEPGDVLELDPNKPGYYRKARGPCSTLVAGVVSTSPGFVLGHGPDTEGKALLALIGIVPVKVIAEGGPIQPGDLLVVSSTPGYAMRWDPESGEPCGFVGKALEPLQEGYGVIFVLLVK